jgi:ribosomal protein S18 acetylase RimI-like enzyme
VILATSVWFIPATCLASRPPARYGPAMTTAQIEVGRAARTDANRIGVALAGAFSDDPVFRWLIPEDAPKRDARLVTFFTSIARSYLRRDKHVYLAGDGVSGALWSAPGSWSLPMTEMLRESRPAVRAFGTNVVRAVRSQLHVESLHPKEPEHWYLGYLGTKPGHQGQGIGSAMLREVLPQADAASTPAYLESSNERNLTLYERHGFRVVDEIRLLGHGPTVWRMLRDPAS